MNDSTTNNKRTRKAKPKPTSWNIRREDYDRLSKIADDFNVSKVKMAGALLKAWNKLSVDDRIKCVVTIK